MAEHDIEIEVAKDGTVTAKVTGAKGPGCVEYAQLIERIVGQLSSTELTAEYCEPGPPVQTKPTVDQRIQR